MNFKGTFSVNITPTESNGNLKLNSLKKYLNWQIQKKIGGLIILGSTGEFLSISSKNRIKMIRESVSITDKRVPLLVGTAAENTYDAIRYSVEAQKLKADGVMIIPPFYSTPTVEELFNHYQMISKEIDLPIMVYNNPATSNIDILPETFNAETTALPRITIDAKRNSIDWLFIKPESSSTKPIRPKMKGTEYFFISKAIFSITILVI